MNAVHSDLTVLSSSKIESASDDVSKSIVLSMAIIPYTELRNSA